MDRSDEKRVGEARAPSRKPATPAEALRSDVVADHMMVWEACDAEGAGAMIVPLPLPAHAYMTAAHAAGPHGNVAVRDFSAETVSATLASIGVASRNCFAADDAPPLSVPLPLVPRAYFAKPNDLARGAAEPVTATAPALNRLSDSQFDDLILALAVPLPMVPAAYAVRSGVNVPSDAEPARVAAALAEPVRVASPLPSVAAVLPAGLGTTATRPALDVRLLPEPAQRLPEASPQHRLSAPASRARAAAYPASYHPVPSWPGVSENQTRPLVRKGPAPPFDLRAPADADRHGLGTSGAAATGVGDGAAEGQGIGRYVRPALRLAVYAIGAWLAIIMVLMALYRFVNPPVSSLMLQQWLSGGEIRQTWVPLDEISPQVVKAVLVSEDGRFCEHWGVDLDAMQDAIESAGSGGNARGASTISMQVVKNLFLWPSKSYVRKAVELPLTWLMELFWSKPRIMEVYLNIAEWGPGIFGVEEASRFHFNKGARRLSEREAAQLAVALPNPFLRDAGDPGPKTRRLAQDIRARMRNASRWQTGCVINGRRR